MPAQRDGGMSELGTTPTERYRRARAFATEKKIDLASAYSVLLGTIPIDDAVAAPPDERFDPEFDHAVTEGFLTVQQAVERGERGVYASTLQQRYDLQSELAFLVTDNRMRLSEALAVQAASASDHRSTHLLWNIVQVGTAVVVLGMGMFAMLRPRDQPAAFSAAIAATAGRLHLSRTKTPDPPPVPAEPPELVVFKTDAQGRVIEVSGPDPNSVLVALCKHTQFAATLSPIAVAPAVPPSVGERLGFVRDSRDLSARLCIPIRRDSRTGRWFAGDRRDPIEAQRAPL